MEEVKSCIIFAGGDFVDFCSEGYIICADSGIINAQKNGLKPDLVLGDFDSYSGVLPQEAEQLSLPAEKDDTDLYYAVKEAVKRGFDDITLVSVLGSRPDHNFAAYSSLLYLAEHHCSCRIIGKDCLIYCLKNSSARFYRDEKYKYISLLPLEGDAFGVSIDGVKYPLLNATIKSDFPIGVSNEIISDYCTVKVDNGTLLVMRTN
jgi:thiamine diphosphokinase